MKANKYKIKKGCLKEGQEVELGDVGDGKLPVIPVTAAKDINVTVRTKYIISANWGPKWQASIVSVESENEDMCNLLEHFTVRGYTKWTTHFKLFRTIKRLIEFYSLGKDQYEKIRVKNW